MGARLPVFPLGTVLFPGLVLPLHIFEARYLELMQHLIDLPDGAPREFGVVAIRSGGAAPVAMSPEQEQPSEQEQRPEQPSGREQPSEQPSGPEQPSGQPSGPEQPPGQPSGPEQPPGRPGPEQPSGQPGPGRDRPASELGGRHPDGPPVTLHEVGCTAELRQVTELPNGRLDVVTVGRRRFRIANVDEESTPYLTAEVEWLPEPAGQEELADLLAPRVLAVFRRYLTLIRDDPDEISEQLPDDPTVLSHLVAATAALTLADRQRLLATPDTAGRLSAELRLLNREAALLRQVRAVPVPLTDLAVPASPN